MKVTLLCFLSLLTVFTNGNVLIKPFLNGRIFGGESTTIEEHPYQISIEYDGRFGCGGSILSPSVILTAAHCTYGTSRELIKIRAGTTIRGQGGVLKSVEKIYIHESFGSTLDYDVSLIVLNESLIYSTKIQSISLPDETEYLDAKESALTTGWGRTEWTESGMLADILQKIIEPIVDQEVCNDVYTNKITPRMLCAGYMDVAGKGACFGDSGGPLVSKNKQHGIVSWGSDKCIKKGYPTVYTRVTAVREWIRSKVNL